MSTSSLDEKEKEWRLNGSEAAAEGTKQYQPIVTEPLEVVGTEKNLEVDLEKRSTRGSLSRLQSGTSGFSETSDDVSDTKSSASANKRWYKKLNPLKRGKKPPVPETRAVCREYQASWFSLITFQWMAPLMTVSEISSNKCSVANASVFVGRIPTPSRAQRFMDRKPR